jgi:hypothetical protein
MLNLGAVDRILRMGVLRLVAWCVHHATRHNTPIPNADLQKVFANKIKRVQACIDARGHHFQQILWVHNDFPNADLRKVFANKIKRVQACIDARGHHFQQPLWVHNGFPNAVLHKVFANKIKRVQACIDARGHHFQQLL